MGLSHLLTAASLRWKADDKAGVIGMGALGANLPTPLSGVASPGCDSAQTSAV